MVSFRVCVSVRMQLLDCCHLFRLLCIGDISDQRARVVNAFTGEETAPRPAGSLSGLDRFESELQKQLLTVLRTRVLRGFPLNLSFTDVDEIVTKVREGGL